jgi:15-cis-phytoene synthase
MDRVSYDPLNTPVEVARWRRLWRLWRASRAAR